MANLLMLKNGDESLTIDLLDGTYKLRDKSWATSTPQPNSDYDIVPFGAHPRFQNYARQVETLDLIANESSTATIRAAQREISEALDIARLYHQHPLWTILTSVPYTGPWFLHWNTDGETEKRSLIYEGSLSTLNEQATDPFFCGSTSLLRMAIARHPFWEPVYNADTIIGPSAVSAWGGTTTITSIPGDVWARMQDAELYFKTGGTIYRTWVGIREQMGGYSNFEPIWECEDGTVYNGAADAVDATASGGDKVQKASPASTLTRYWSMTVGDVCAANGHSDNDHQMGEYLVLCRCKVDSGTVGLQLRYGFDSTATTMPNEEVFITNTSWRLIEVGRVCIPPTGADPLLTSGYAAYTKLEIMAEQVLGTSTLDLDALCLIPTHHFWQTTGSDIRTSSDHVSVVTTSPDDRFTSYGWEGSAPRFGVEYSLKDWYLPTHNSIAVVAGEHETSHVLTDEMYLEIHYFPRWGMYRGISGT